MEISPCRCHEAIKTAPTAKSDKTTHDEPRASSQVGLSLIWGCIRAPALSSRPLCPSAPDLTPFVGSVRVETLFIAAVFVNCICRCNASFWPVTLLSTVLDALDAHPCRRHVTHRQTFCNNKFHRRSSASRKNQGLNHNLAGDRRFKFETKLEKKKVDPRQLPITWHR